ncbi:structural cement protein Gp24 [Avibacterium paragallinarum]|uniref:structural cement protein Gp24 n=1 Tax=Avibacterium paragallinarum TaxID=728 RepID=UPI003987E7EF
MAYANSTTRTFAGEVGKGGLASAKTTSEQFKGKSPIQAGLFVAIDATGGVKPLSAVTDVIAGVIVRSLIKDDFQPNDLVDVMHITQGDSVWVTVGKGVSVVRGDKVYVRAVKNGDKEVGTIDKAEDSGKTVATDFVVINATEHLAEITRL